MNLALKIVIGLIALLFLVMGGGLLIDPASATAQFGLESTGVVGLSTLRGDLAGMFLASALMLALGLVRGNTTWVLAVAVLMALIAFGRLVGFVADGADPATVTAFVAELVIVALLYLGHRRLSNA